MVNHFLHARLAPLALSVALAATGGAAHAAATYYVSPSGSDSNAGTSLTAPWKTIKHAAQVATAGATVNVRAGTYNEIVNVANSGSASGGFITFQPYGSEAAVLDGTGVSCCGGDMVGFFNIASKSYVIVKGFEMRNLHATAASSEPSGVTITGSGSNVQVLDNRIHDIGITTALEKKNGNAHGIVVYGTATTPYSAVTISGNEVWNMKTGWSETVTFDGNVTNFTASNNVIHDNDNIGLDCIGFEGTGPSGHDQANNGVFSGNVIYNITSASNGAYAGDRSADGLYCDGCTNVLIERNLVYSTDLGLEATSETKGKTGSYVTVRDNIFYDSYQADISIGGYATSAGGSDHVTMVNNTLYEPASAVGSALQVQYHATNNVFENNVVYVSNTAPILKYFATDTSNAIVMDYNDYDSSGANATWLWKNKTYTGLGAFQSTASGAPGQEAHGKYADPLFANLAGHDFHVAATSPAVGAGSNLGASVVGTLDFAGGPRVVNAIDIGAYER